MNKRTFFCAFAVTLAGTALLISLSVSQAEARPGMAAQNADVRFQAMDADKDGKVTREEFFEAHKQMKEGAFLAIDTDKNDSISLEEWKTFTAGHSTSSDPHAGEGGGMGMGMGRGGPSNSTGAGEGKMPELIMPPHGKQ